MDLKGSIADTNIRIYPSQKLISYIQTLSIEENIPDNILQFMDQKSKLNEKTPCENEKQKSAQLNNKDVENLKKIVDFISKIESTKSLASESIPSSDNNSENDIKELDFSEQDNDNFMKGDTKGNVKKNYDKLNNKKETRDEKNSKTEIDEDKSKTENNEKSKDEENDIKRPYLMTTDLDWLYSYLNKLRNQYKENTPYIHELLTDSEIVMPENKIIKRNPVLEARCVKLRAQQEAREYRKMTRCVDNVRIRYPEDSISYQLKQLNRQLIAVLQFVLSIASGFLFGFKGIEWIVGPLDFGVRLLLGIMVSLIIAIAEIYFLAKKLNEELNIPETIQLGGRPILVDDSKSKLHQD